MAQTFGQPFAQLLYRGRLIAGRFEVGNEPEVWHRNLVGVGPDYTARGRLARMFCRSRLRWSARRCSRAFSGTTAAYSSCPFSRSDASSLPIL